MKKYKSISLIETLISLAIVGLSITALMPVMTVRKQSADVTKGNILWKCTYSNEYTGPCSNVPPPATNSIIYPNNTNVALLLGTQSYDSTNPKLIVDASGFQNNRILPLYVKEKLNYNGQTVQFYEVNNKISFDMTDRQLIAADNQVVIENGSRTLGAQSGSFYIKNNSAEYIHVDNTNNIIGIGNNAAAYLTNSANNGIVIGSSGDDPVGAVAYSDFVNIGNKDTSQAFAPSVQHNKWVVHYDSNYNFDINATTTFKQALTAETVTANAYIVGSDKNLKNILGKYTKGLSDILKLQPVEFTYKNDEKKKVHVGVIAQDLKKVFPESVIEDKQTGYLNINTDGIFYALLNSVKELNKRNIELEKQNDELEKKLAQLKEIRNKLQNEKGGQDE